MCLLFVLSGSRKHYIILLVCVWGCLNKDGLGDPCGTFNFYYYIIEHATCNWHDWELDILLHYVGNKQVDEGAAIGAGCVCFTIGGLHLGWIIWTDWGTCTNYNLS